MKRLLSRKTLAFLRPHVSCEMLEEGRYSRKQGNWSGERVGKGVQEIKRSEIGSYIRLEAGLDL